VTNIPQFEYVNKSFVSGEVASHPDIRWTVKGACVVRFPILTKHDKCMQRTDCVAFAGHSEEASRLKKGAFVEVVGRLSTRPWDRQVEIVIEGLRVLAEQAALPLTPDPDRKSGAEVGDDGLTR
jgi:single-stranded DNA-binding protein